MSYTTSISLRKNSFSEVSSRGSPSLKLKDKFTTVSKTSSIPFLKWSRNSNHTFSSLPRESSSPSQSMVSPLKKITFILVIIDIFMVIGY